MARNIRSALSWCWRIVYPILLHYAISQFLAGIVMGILLSSNQSPDSYMTYALFVTGLTAAVSMAPAVWFYHRDQKDRMENARNRIHSEGRLTGSEVILLFLMGCALSLYVNLFMSMLQSVIPDTDYAQLMDSVMYGKSLPVMILTMGILAPAAEEIIFRWLVYLRLRDYMVREPAILVSAVLFGVYHGNVFQGVYAGILGLFFAWVLEASGNLFSSILLHVGANVFSLVLTVHGELLLQKISTQMLFALNMAFLASLLFGIQYFTKRKNFDV